MTDKNDKTRDFSDFTLDRPTPRKTYATPKERDTSTVELTSGDASPDGEYKLPKKSVPQGLRTASYSGSGANFNKRPPQRDESSSCVTYSKSGMVREVSVKSWPTTYSFYERFVRDAAFSHSKRGKKAPHVPFFSYIPQYSQLTNSSWAYYLYMKESLREGVRLSDADFSYVLLYVYEIINLEGIISPEEGVETLASIWSLYRPLHPSLDKYMSEWMADYCLSYNVPLPKSLYKIIPEAAARSSAKEFYADYALTSGESLGKLIRKTICDYDPARSRCAAGIEGFAEEVYAVFDAVIEESHRGGTGVFSPSLRRRVTLKRDAFCGSLCASNVKKQITLTLDTFLRTPEASRIAAETMKGCENIVRARHGIKSRLSAPPITGLSPLISAKTETELEYLSYYDAPTTTLSESRAAEIEAESWQNAEILATDDIFDTPETTEEPEGAILSEDFAEDSITETQADTPAENPTPEAEPESFAEAISLEPDLCAALLTCAKGGDFAAYCREKAMFADSAAERINSLAATYIGDVVLEKSGVTYTFVEDYADELPEG